MPSDPQGSNATPATLTDAWVRDILQRNRRYRDLEYLCRAYLQFGRESLTNEQLLRLCEAINKFNKESPP